jgi:histidine triad (HIT) family protein
LIRILIYDLPSALSARIHDLEKEVAIAFKKAYKSHGVSSRQHNEHAGNQDVWHYHLHVFPRYDNDNFYLTHKKKKLSTPSERKKYAQKLKNYFNKKKKR